MVICRYTRINPNHITISQELLRMCDDNKDGQLSLEELTGHHQHLGWESVGNFGELWGFDGISGDFHYGFYGMFWDVMGFYGDFMGSNDDLMGFLVRF